MQKVFKLAKLKMRKVMNCPPEELIHLDWAGEWKPFRRPQDQKRRLITCDKGILKNYNQAVLG